MNAPIISFFNNKGGVGKTSLVYHLAWMYVDLGLNVLAADLDPQANLTAAFLEEDRLEELWPDGLHDKTVYGSIEPLLRGIGDILDEPHTEEIEERLHLLVGDLDLSRFEDELSVQWPLCLDGKERAFRVISAFWRILVRSGEKIGADVILVDLGPNLGSINRSALVATDYLVVPLAPDLFSLQGLKNLGPTILRWRKEWKDRLDRNPVKDLNLPEGRIEPIGYVVMQHAVRFNRPVRAYQRWMARIPRVYAEEVLGQKTTEIGFDKVDSNRLGLVKHYQSMMPMAQEAHKPMFHLLPADGAIGSHRKAVSEAKENFKQLAYEIAKRCHIAIR
ncbi:ParA family protein [Candidatus Methanocrinis natronophilus]|uniref:AAA family ATPase n=1 Tax=Candidatus Methanocrinis natronophilus TaxID=3033396 RepID=A0ABT5X9W2_9EURY|nr:AAA family ATPase [Candidatus Methanocrinis natronophilus]MDF0591494.1 AAA family ATPase [Candidatus Methanocrinis natronophilus]